MANVYEKAFYVIDTEWGLESRVRYPKSSKMQNKVIDCIKLKITRVKRGPKGSKFQVNSEDGWYTFLRTSYVHLTCKDMMDQAIDKWLDAHEDQYHYKDSLDEF